MSSDYSDITNYEFKKDIGEGNFGKVKLGIFKPTGEEFAIKVLNKEKIRKKMKNLALRENEIITKLNHINIVLVYCIIDTKEDFYIIMEYCKLGELFDYIVKYKRLEEDESCNFFYQLINGVEYIHSQGIAHRDLKPENLLLTEKKILKIIDFGLSHEFEEEEFLKTKCGSPSYAAPEIISKPNYNGFKIDIWCCGIILYAMLCGYLPFDGDDDGENNNVKLFQNILECEPELPDFLSDMSKDLIMSILNPDPDKRITIEQIKEHPFYLKGKNLCTIDYSSNEKEIIKTRQSFFKHVKDDNKANTHDNLKEHDNYLNKNNSESANKITNKNYKGNKTDGNIKSNGKHSIDIISNSKYKFTVNIESRNNNHSNLASIDNTNKATKGKLHLLSFKNKNKNRPSNELNTFKRKFNPINLHIGKNINNKIKNILNTEANESAKHGLPFIGQKETDNMFNYLLSNRLKFKMDNSSNNSINLIKNSEENISSNNKIKFGQHLNNKINHILMEKQLNNNNVLENIKKNLDNNNINVNSHKDIKLSDVHKTKMKSSERIKRNLNLHLNNITNNNHRKHAGNMTNTINTYVPGKLTLSLSSENKINRKSKINKNYKYNYDYNYNFNSSPNKHIFINNSRAETLNVSNDVNKKNRNRNVKETKTIIPFHHDFSKKNIMINNSPNKNNFGIINSSEIKTLINNLQVNNIGDIPTTKTKDNLKYNFMKDIKFNNIINMPKENSDNKLYMLTDANNQNEQNIKKNSKMNSKNYIIYSERSNKRNGISLSKGINKEKKYNLTKVIKDTQSDKKGVKKNRSFGHNLNDEEVNNNQNRNIKKLILRKGSNEKNKREDLLRYALFNGNKNHKYNNFNNLITLNNNLLPKLNEHMYNNNKNEKFK